MIERTLRDHLLELFARYPVVTITGPRQAGKTTLCRTALPDLEYVNLERPDVREMASDDPRGFLRRYPEGVIFDEIQRAPPPGAMRITDLVTGETRDYVNPINTPFKPILDTSTFQSCP